MSFSTSAKISGPGVVKKGGGPEATVRSMPGPWDNVNVEDQREVYPAGKENQ